MERAWRWCKRSPVVAGLTTLAALLLLALSIVSLFLVLYVAEKERIAQNRADEAEKSAEREKELAGKEALARSDAEKLAGERAIALKDLEQIRELLRVAVLQQGEASSNPEMAREQFDLYARLLSAGVVKRDFHSKLRERVREFCELYLRPSLRLDDRVIILQGTGEVEADRESVKIQWKNKNTKERLVDTGYDEFTLQDDKVDRYWVGNTSYDGPIKGTVRSIAARHYNKHRKNLNWTVASLRDLLKETESYPAELRDVRKRMEVILQAFKAHPELFRPGE